MGRRGRCRIGEGWRVRDVSAARGDECPRFDLARLEGTPDKPTLKDKLLVPFGFMAEQRRQAASPYAAGRPTNPHTGGGVREGPSPGGHIVPWSLLVCRYSIRRSSSSAPDDVRLYSGHAEEHAGGPPRSLRITSVEQPTRASVPGLASPPRSRPRQNAPSIVACGESSPMCRRV